jgi:cytochrome c'
MVQIDARFEALQQWQRGGWRAPSDPPDRMPAHEALQLRELFHELPRNGAVAARPADFKGWMHAAESGTAAMEVALRGGDQRRADIALGQVAAACAACHARYRNVPQAG